MLIRFIDRLALPSSTEVVLNSVEKLSNKFIGNEYLELYHTINASNIKSVKLKLQSIVDNGFNESEHENKGVGVSLSSHSSYGFHWKGSHLGMIVCNVNINDHNKIKRYISEIPPGYEYIISKDIIIPKYFIEYEVMGSKGNNEPRVLGNFGCTRCDEIGVKCNCPLLPSVYPSGNILYHIKNNSCPSTCYGCWNCETYDRFD